MEERTEESKGVVWAVDDEASHRVLLQLQLEHLGYEVRMFGDSQELLDVLTGALAEGAPPDALMTDNQMPPNLTGMQLTEAIRQLDGGQSLPIVMYATDYDRAVKREAMEKGVDVFVAKGEHHKVGPVLDAALEEARAKHGQGTGASGASDIWRKREEGKGTNSGRQTGTL